MLAKVVCNIFLLIGMACIISPAHFPQHCSECEEEMWEEFPCDEITTSTTTISPTTTIATTSSTVLPPTRPYITPPSARLYIKPTQTSTSSSSGPVTVYNTTSVPYTAPVLQDAAEMPDVYKKCYCECKLGCKEFCRKVIVDADYKKQTTQITQTMHKVLDGRVETKHLHQRKFLPASYRSKADYISTTGSYVNSSPYIDSVAGEQKQQYLNQYQQHQHQQQAGSRYSGENSVELNNIYNIPNPIYSVSDHYPDVSFDSSAYSADQLTKLLHSEHLDKSVFASATPIIHLQHPSTSYAYGIPIDAPDSKASMYSPIYSKSPTSELKINSNYGDSNSNYVAKNPCSEESDTYKQSSTNVNLDSIEGYLKEYIYA